MIIIVTTPNIYFLATSQYQIINFPPLFCGAGVDVNFYGIILPTVVINCASLIMMLLVLQKIHGVSIFIQCVYNLNQNSQAVIKECGPQKGQDEKRCEIQGGC